MEKIVPDTSVLINGALSRMIESEELRDCELIIPLAAIDELQAQASKGRDIGLKGLEEIKRIRELAESKNIRIRFSGERPSLDDIRLARSGRIDALIRDVARAEGGRLYTSDYVQALVAEAEGIPVNYIEPYRKPEEPVFKRYLGPGVISLHLRAGSKPYAEVLRGGRLERVALDEKPCDEEILNSILEEAMAAARLREDADIIMLRPEILILETRDYRIRVAKPPFSDRLEAVIQRNILQVVSEEALVDPVVRECVMGARGIIVLNSSGIYSFPIAERIGEKLRDHGFEVGILGRARRINTSIPYYGPLDGDLEKALELILSSPPDYIILDEVSSSRDLRLIRESRLAGPGVVAFLRGMSITSAMTMLLDAIPVTALAHVIDEIMITKLDGVAEVWSLSASIRAPSVPELGVRLVIELARGNEPLYEVFEVDGRPHIQALKGRRGWR